MSRYKCIANIIIQVEYIVNKADSRAKAKELFFAFLKSDKQLTLYGEAAYAEDDTMCIMPVARAKPQEKVS